ncbi:glutathione S-transferase family protein [Paracoccaceae bacterium GXU_MW_L88]
MHKLYHLPLCPFSRKVRLVLGEKKIETELVEERPWDKRMDFLRLNPAGQVPVLSANGVILAESQAICEYLEELHSDPRLIPTDLVNRAEVRRLCGWFDGKMWQEVTGNLLVEKVNKRLMKTGSPDSAKIKAGLQNIRFHIDYCDWLLESRKWLAGDNMTLADLTAAAHFSCLDYIDVIEWNRSQNLRDWYAKVKSRPSFRGLLADQVPPFRPPAHYRDLDF